MPNVPPFPTELLRRYDRPGPRYTSYPTEPQFSTGFGPAQLMEAAQQSNGDPIPGRLSLYVHVPFCSNPCFHCGCNRVITRDRSRSEPYRTRLGREIGMMAGLFDPDREVVQLHFGGGTPNFLTPAQLHATLQDLRDHFRFSPAAEGDISIDLDPRELTPEDVAELVDAGFNRASLGVVDLDTSVQDAVNRGQDPETTLTIIDACHRHGMRSVDVELIYGLPKQTLEGFARTLHTLIAARPHRLAVYSYAHLPEQFRPQRQIRTEDLPSPELKLELLQLAVQSLTNAGYVHIGMDHFALPDDDLALAQSRGGLHRNVMGYTTHADGDLIGLGVSAVSRIGDSVSQNTCELSDWERAIDQPRLPVWRGLRLTPDDQLRSDVIQRLMCQGEVPIDAIQRAHGIDFAQYFADSLRRLEPLQDDGLVWIEPERIVATPVGRLMLRVIAMCFDAYAPHLQAAGARYPRTA
ncbi:oxygen-independent coproporphyrinogen III oxidase [Lysobacter sp. LF1]|uniref:Coproporphyrinogen-III oxidase n=1 Tax=Lysobacter stagni TaxID=3045172 RepID=A0ABT6XFH4_9GAMM|nr:oxygen-independent coproporphyrinogen III oxidase [Lysobacter sp. LF1]MDI9238625.1 oxygen-independent coproporphyrinogen III oxidase [Lysobacter sp. LF1]